MLSWSSIGNTKRALLTTFLMLGVMTYPAKSGSLSERAGQVKGIDFVRAFIGMCGQNAGNYDFVVNGARSLGFQDLPDEMKPFIAPQNPNAEFLGFLALEGDGAPFLLGVSKSLDSIPATISCVVANPFIDLQEVLSALKEVMDIGQPISDEKEMGQRFRIWSMNSWVDGSYLTLTDSEPMGYSGATLGISAPSIR